MSKYMFYPGCSMESSAKAYDKSLWEIVETLDMDMEVIDDWNCCGATEYCWNKPDSSLCPYWSKPCFGGKAS